MRLPENLDLNEDLRALVLIVLMFTSGWGVYHAIGLYGDGSLWLAQILARKTFLNWDWTRSSGMMITQIPLVLGIKLGIGSIPVLIRLQSLGLVGIPALFWCFALRMQWQSPRFWLFVFALAASFYSCALYVIGVHVVLYSMVALSAAILLREGRLTCFNYLVLLMLAMVMVQSYAAMVFLGPLLFGITVAKLSSPELNAQRWFRLGRACLVCSASLYLLAALISAWAIYYPTFPEQLENAINIGLIAREPSIQYFALTTVLFAAYLLLRGEGVRRMTLVLVLGVSLAFLLIDQVWLQVTSFVMMRVVAGVALFLALLLAALWYFSCAPGEQEERGQITGLQLIPFTLSLVLSAALVFHLYGFGNWLAHFERQVNSRVGYVPWSDVAPAIPAAETYLFGWPNPSLSILLRNDGSKTVILAPIGPYHTPSDLRWQLRKFSPHFFKDQALF